MNVAARSIGVALVFQCMSAIPAAGQTVDEIRIAAEDASGCYEVAAVRSPPGWLRSIERRIWLTMEELARDDDGESPVFVMRPAPGQRAGSYPSTRWTIVDAGSRIAIRWGSGFVFVVVTFPLMEEFTKEAVYGTASYHSDTLEPPSTVQVRVRRLNC